MKKKQEILFKCIMAGLLLLLCGCSDPATGQKSSDDGHDEQSAVSTSESGESLSAQRWAYVHDPTAEVLILGEDGWALYKGEKYDCQKDDQYITLKKADNQELKLRYAMKKDNLILYETTVYHYVSGNATAENPIIGLWQGGEEDRLSYEFTEKGTYLEDGIFPGHYQVDEEQGTIKLMYNDHFEDTYLYYSFEDGNLVIEYPWPMVQVGTGN